MPKQQLVLNDFSGGLNTYQDPRDLQMNELQTCQNFTFQRRNSLASIGSFVTHADAGSSQLGTISGGYGLFSFESDFSPVAYEAVDTSQSTNIFFGTGGDDSDVSAGTGTIAGGLNGYSDDVVIVSSHTNSGLKDANITSLKPGDTIMISGTAKNNGLYTISFIGDSITVANDAADNSYTNSANVIGVQTSPAWLDNINLSAETKAANNTDHGAVSIKTHTLGENLLVLSDVNNGNLDVYKKSNDAFENGAINAFSLGGAEASAVPEFAFYAVDNQLRVSDGRNRSAAFEVAWYGYVERNHFRNITYSNVNVSSSGKGLYKGFYEANNRLEPPVSARTDTSDTYPSGQGTTTLSNPNNGGFSIKYTNSSANAASNWQTETWKIAVSFVYDGNQESLLYVPTSNNTFVTTAGNELTLRVMAKIGASITYAARVSGGRIYYKPSDTEGEPWTLLCNVDLEEGVSASLTGDKTGWTSASAVTLYSDITILNPNIDTYESINGYSPDVNRNSIGYAGEGWKTGLVTNRRAFVANIKVKNALNNNKTIYGDRIMYSMPNKFDTFPSFNFIDVVKGDAEAYLKLESFADRLIAFKHNSVQVINISSPSDTNWFLETDIKNNGVAHPAAVFRSEKGILWANEKGMFLYDGSVIRSLTENKIAQNEWASFITAYSIVGYDGNSNMAMVIRDCENAGVTQGDAYIFDFKTKAWSFATDLLEDSVGNYTNFITDYNGNLTIGTQNNGDIDLKTFSHTTLTSIATDGVEIKTKDIDFGSPNSIKKIYAVYITYKSDVAQSAPVAYSKDGSTTYTALTGNFINTSGAWKVLRAYRSSGVEIPIGEFKSISIRVRNESAATGSGSAGLQINDIAIEYRNIRGKTATSDT